MPTRKASPAVPPAPAAQLAAFVSRFSPGIVALVKRCLPGIRRAVPCTHEVVYNYAHAVVVSFGMSERGYEAIVALSIEADRLRLYFDKSLPDPHGLLEGAGAKVRSVTINAASDLDRAEIQALFRAAVKRSGGTLSRSPTTRSTRMIIKSASKSKKPARRKTRAS